MKEKIYTIPVNEAFDDAKGCPFCFLLEKLEQDRIKYTLGASMMEPDAREITNSLGFCKKHFKMLFNEPNKLSLALVLDTHLDNVQSKLDLAAAPINKTKKSSGLFKKKGADSADILALSIDNITKSCAVCTAVNATMDRYIDVFFYMWENDSNFAKKFDECQGMCLDHYSMLLKMSDKYLKKSSREKFLESLLEKQRNLLASLKEDIHKFTLKFDYRNADMPWGSAKDAPKRVIECLSGETLVGKED